MKLKRNIAALAMAGAAAGALTVGAAGTAQAAPSGDPLSTGCANGAQTIWENTYFGSGKVEVRYSPSCGTNWVKVTNAAGRQSEAGIASQASGWQWSPSYGNSPNAYWTPMVYAPGSACVTFRVKIGNANGIGMMDTGNKQLC